jgi:hypothetical protein
MNWFKAPAEARVSLFFIVSCRGHLERFVFAFPSLAPQLHMLLLLSVDEFVPVIVFLLSTKSTIIRVQ